MRIFIFAFEDGPVAYNCHEVEIEAVNYSQALRKATEYIKENYTWELIGHHNIRYRGMKK